MAGADSVNHFEPRSINAKAFLSVAPNPADGINERVIDDVVNEVQPTFEEDGVPNEVLEMLKNLWLRKLNERENDIEEYETIPETEIVASPSRASTVEGSWPPWVEGKMLLYNFIQKLYISITMHSFFPSRGSKTHQFRRKTQNI